MNNENESTGSFSGQSQASNISSMFGQELHDLGDKIERIAERLKNSGKQAEGDELYQLGDEVEHFFDRIKSASSGSSSTVNSNNESQ